MKINFKGLGNQSQDQLIKHAKWLAEYSSGLGWPGDGYTVPDRKPPEGYESYTCIDALGPEFVWLNENFPKEKYTWYLWFESVFLVPPEMATFLKLKWS